MPWRKLLLLNLPSLTWFFFHVTVDWRSYASCPAIARSLLWQTVDLPILVESEPLHDHVARILSVKNANRSNCILRFVTLKENTKKTIKQLSRKSPYLDRYLWQTDNTWIWRQFTLDCQVLPIYISAMMFCVKKLMQIICWKIPPASLLCFTAWVKQLYIAYFSNWLINLKG